MKPTVSLTRDRLIETLRWIGLAAASGDRPATPPRFPGAARRTERTDEGRRR